MQDKLDLEDDLKHERRRLNSFQKAQVVEGKRPLGLDIPESRRRTERCTAMKKSYGSERRLIFKLLRGAMNKAHRVVQSPRFNHTEYVVDVLAIESINFVHELSVTGIYVVDILTSQQHHQIYIQNDPVASKYFFIECLAMYAWLPPTPQMSHAEKCTVVRAVSEKVQQQFANMTTNL